MRALERCVAWAVRLGAPLAVPLSLLLFLQWPLRDLVQAGSREANDAAQVLFAAYIAVALTAATRGRTHLAADVVARRYPPRWRARLARFASLAVAAPFALFVLWTGAPAAWNSLLQLEHFPETLNPGYFLLRAAALLLAALALAQALLDARAATHGPG
jgi:TRAP-type C4-dicarboxylate transport system permease small subunit